MAQRLALITGGMGGLGETISTKMSDAGYRVVVTYSPSNTKYKSWLEEMKGRGYSFSAYPVDVVDFDDCARNRCSCSRSSGVNSAPKSSASNSGRISITASSPGIGSGQRFTHAIASSREATWIIQKPATR